MGLNSCSVTKNLNEDQKVQVSSNIIFTNPKLINKKNKVRNDLTALSQPKPAEGIRKFQTYIYNAVSKNKKEKGLKNWIAQKIGRPPVLYDAKLAKRTQLVFQKYIQDNGYFGATVSFDTLQKKQSIDVTYKITSKGQYFIQSKYLPTDSVDLGNAIVNSIKRTSVKTGNPYSQINLTNERIRLAKAANNAGFMNVNQDNFYFIADTTVTNHQVDIHYKIKEEKDSSVYKKFYLNKVIVYADYSLTKRAQQKDTIHLDHFSIIQQNEIIHPKLLKEIIGDSKNDVYSKKEQDASIARLLDLGVYKFVNLKFEQFEKDSTLYFNKILYLTPGLFQDITSEFQLNTRTGNNLGVGASLNYSNKNLFRGAEQFNINLSGGLETQIGNAQNLLNTTNLGIETRIQFPKFLAPFRTTIGRTTPKTYVRIGDDFQRRFDFFSINAFKSRFGYEWTKQRGYNHQFDPFYVNQITVFNESIAFQDSLANDLRLQKSFENVFILGLRYYFELNTVKPNKSLPYAFLKTGFETSGNTAALFAKPFNKNAQKPYTIVGTPFSQFVWTDVDFRYYVPRKKGLIATRFYTGIGIPFGNSSVLPYVKQFFSGGSNGLRAYRIRALGPGGFKTDNQESNNSVFIDQTGDIKLELNLEYRFPIISYLKGGVFLDAGNIWLLEEDADKPDGEFQFNSFYKQIAIGTGLGIRLDFDYVVVRFDAAFPIRRNYATNNSYWTFSKISFGDKTWRQENLVWHFAIGYPF